MPQLIVEATVKYPPGKAFPSRYGERINAVFTLPSGEEIKLYRNADDLALKSLKKGQKVKLLRDGNKVCLVHQTEPGEPSAQLAPSPPPQAWTPDEKRLIAAQVSQHADLLAHCLQVAQARFSDLVTSEESIRALATTLFIQATRNYTP